MKSKWWIWVIAAIVLLAIIGACTDDGGSSGNSNTKYEYDVNDKYYRENDHNKDGKISDKEFQDAVGDWLDDHGY